MTPSRFLRAALAAAVLLLPLHAPVHAQEGAEPASLVELRSLTEIDLARELIEKGRALVAEGGELAASGEARAIVARALFAAGEEAEAEALLDESAVAESERAWLVLERANLHLVRDELSSAIELLVPAGSQEVRYEATHPETLLVVARALGRAGELDRAVPLCQRFLQRAALHPRASAAWHLLAQASLQRGNGERAREFLDRAAFLERWHAVLKTRRLQVRRAPNDPLPRLGLALVWMEVESWSRALPILQALTKDHPDFARGWSHLGEVLRRVGEPAAAYASYGRALEIDSGAHMARYNRAVIDLLAGRPEKAQPELEVLAGIESVAKDPNYAGVWLHLARLADDAGESARVTEYMGRYRELGGTEPLRR